MSIHIFWDNSNVWGCAQNARAIIEPEVSWVAFRVYFKNLYKLVVNGRDVITKIMAGSVPPECDSLWEYGRELGFDIDLLQRVESSAGRMQEQAVDEILHMKMANAIADFEPPQTMVLLSGDGKVSKFGTSFPGQVERALKKGWKAEIYTWENCYNKPAYQPLVDKFGSDIKIVFLEPFYRQLTFVQEKEFYLKGPTGERVYFKTTPRVVEQL
jgi:hypothetical protein